jgi:plastocyanin
LLANLPLIPPLHLAFSSIMLFQSVLASSLLLIASTMAQSGSRTQGSSSPSASGVAGPDGNMVSVQVVQVSNMNATLKYYPEDIKAEPGSMVQFQFYPKVRNHRQV